MYQNVYVRTLSGGPLEVAGDSDSSPVSATDNQPKKRNIRIPGEVVRANLSLQKWIWIHGVIGGCLRLQSAPNRRRRLVLQNSCSHQIDLNPSTDPFL